MLQVTQQDNTTVWKCEEAQPLAVMGFGPAKHTLQTAPMVPGLKIKVITMPKLPGQKAVLGLY